MSARRAVLAALLGLAVSLAAGCTGAPREPRPGDQFVLARKAATPGGLQVERETWTLADTAGGALRWRVVRAGVAPREHLSTSADLAAGRPPVRRGRRLAEQGVRVRVPAGEFVCARRTRTFEESGGRVMQVDEWWAPGVPVPVQRWTRWSGLPERLRLAPPRRDADLVLGAEWAVLERAPRR